ncbi:hypothetical protein K505DRAFT_417498 [Melanomma pulvis-pyrius CBS 109.77]|uniref:Heterokaryon incompatibility domain-containing protein n=1 Tax=Melanomma pulvis-pyrius CBS 109.77 TaxID=1314802 RepID=A0A6A6XCX9_9PLEO|nr:hypothetical protein K505DRAFT_417498 [Melanomma pulvis-pyrius CBS 109.77]
MQHLGLNIPEGEFDVTNCGNEYLKTCFFYDFPATQGWNLDTSTYKFKKDTSKKTVKFPQLMQSWLFFGLIAAVVYDDNCRTFDPALLVTVDKSKICTDNLVDILNDWYAWEQKEENRKGQEMRMIRAQLALDLARKVVKQYCSYENLEMEGRVHGPFHLDSSLALSLMVLGETLTNAKARILNQIEFNISGWSGDATMGWGTPLAVLEKMKRANWCPRTMRLLRAQLRENATALLSVYLSHRGHTFVGHKEANCDEDVCRVKSEDSRFPNDYATKHHPSCLHIGLGPDCTPNETCHHIDDDDFKKDEEIHESPTCHAPCHEMIGVDIEKVVRIIDKGKIPLIKFKRRESLKDPIELDVIENTSCKEYATISHVWSDGYGNVKHNKLWGCQLDYFWELLKEAQAQRTRQNRGESRLKPEPLPFWIDTLTIPVQKEHKPARKKAVGQIFDVYLKARYTIVIDNGLNSMTWTDKYTTTAMRILASGWMRRLWTLQEAYLSRKLFFAFKPYGDADAEQPLVDLDEIEELFVETNDELVSNLAVNARSYYHNMLGRDRKARIHELTSTNSVGLIASVWRAAQWRTTSHLEHETLALATLLNLDYQDKSFGTAELLNKKEDKEGKLNEMMKDFWMALEESYPGSIPPGIIFLPGDRIKLKGFGWAPRSWMSAQGVDHPDPISIISKSATLLPLKGGLLVEFPGFYLHSEDRSAIVGATDGKGFWFPSDNSLVEWYHVSWADEKEYSIKKGIIDESRSEEFAIILSRPRPREIGEIGVLVEIYDKRKQRELGTNNQRWTFAVYMLCRVYVRRETDEVKLKQKRQEMVESRRPEDRSNVICGQTLDEEQKWFVDKRITSMSNTREGDTDEEVAHATSEVDIPAAARSRPIGIRGQTEGVPQPQLDAGTSYSGTEASDDGSGVLPGFPTSNNQDPAGRPGLPDPASSSPRKQSLEVEEVVNIREVGNGTPPALLRRQNTIMTEGKNEKDPNLFSRLKRHFTFK